MSGKRLLNNVLTVTMILVLVASISAVYFSREPLSVLITFSLAVVAVTVIGAFNSKSWKPFYTSVQGVSFAWMAGLFALLITKADGYSYSNNSDTLMYWGIAIACVWVVSSFKLATALTVVITIANESNNDIYARVFANDLTMRIQCVTHLVSHSYIKSPNGAYQVTEESAVTLVQLVQNWAFDHGCFYTVSDEVDIAYRF